MTWSVVSFDCDETLSYIELPYYVTTENVAEDRRIVGSEKVFLIPGVGAQGGDINSIRNVASDNILINVGRAIIYAEDPRDAAQVFAERLDKR